MLKYPEDGIVKIRSLGEKNAAKLPHFHGIIKDVTVLGFDKKPEWQRTEEALVLSAKNVKSDKPVVFKISVD